MSFFEKLSGTNTASKTAVISAIILVFSIPASTNRSTCRAETFAETRNKTFARLERVRKSKRRSVAELLKRTGENAEKAAHDEMLTRYFDAIHELRDMQKQQNTNNSEKMRKIRNKIHHGFEMQYLMDYIAFHDILLVDASGCVFHSVKRESDLGKNVFEDGMFPARLIEGIRRGESGAVFVDFVNYKPSQSPIAFFVVPVGDDAENKGFFVFKYRATTFNSLLGNREELGRTGEIYLVNSDGFMLTNSRFRRKSNSLKIRLENGIMEKTRSRPEGSDVIDDYRGVSVFSSYERFDVFDTSWIIMAEINRSEIITECFMKRGGCELESLLAYLGPHEPVPLVADRDEDDFGLVQMDDFSKCGAGEKLATYGVSTCTALYAVYPGAFGYLSHITPHDNVYTDDFITNQVKRIHHDITHYDIHLSELKNLKFIVVATHLESCPRIIEKLTRYGIYLSQITFAYNPAADFADVYLDMESNEATVVWTKNSGGGKQRQMWNVTSSGSLESAYLKMHEGQEEL